MVVVFFFGTNPDVHLQEQIVRAFFVSAPTKVGSGPTLFGR